MTKRQSETEPATKTVAEVAHSAGGVRQWCASNGSLAARNMAPGPRPSCYPVGAHARIAGSVRPTSDVTARKPRYYRHFSEPVLWRDVMCEKTSGKPRGFGARGRKNRRSVFGIRIGSVDLDGTIRAVMRYLLQHDPQGYRVPNMSRITCRRCLNQNRRSRSDEELLDSQRLATCCGRSSVSQILAEVRRALMYRGEGGGRCNHLVPGAGQKVRWRAVVGWSS